jgi:hypothetical protein
MQRRLVWPANGIESLNDLEDWYDDLLKSWNGFHIAQRNPIFAEVGRVCEAVPSLISNIDWGFVCRIAYDGLDLALENLSERVAGNPSRRRYSVDYDDGVPRQEGVEYPPRPTKGKLPVDPRLAVKVARLKGEGMTLVEIAGKCQMRVYRNKTGSASAPSLSPYLKRGREILNRYDAPSRPCLHVPSIEDCLEYGWILPAINC